MPITLINTTPLVQVVHPGVPAKTVKELIALARAKPGKLNFGFRHRWFHHLAGELFDFMAGVKMVYIPYKGNAGALRTSSAVTLTSSIRVHISDRADPGEGSCVLAVTSLKRTPTLPDVPTLDELGLKGSSGGLERPQRSGENATRHHRKDQCGCSQDNWFAGVERAAQGRRIVFRRQHTRRYAAFLRREVAKWPKVIKVAGVKAE